MNYSIMQFQLDFTFSQNLVDLVITLDDWIKFRLF